MVSKTFNVFASKAPPKATRDALDVAARYFRLQAIRRHAP